MAMLTAIALSLALGATTPAASDSGLLLTACWKTVKLGHFVQAVALCTSAERSLRNPKQRASALAALAVAHARTGEHVRAARDAFVALRLDPDNVDALVFRADLFCDVGDIESAERDIERARKIAPKTSKVHVVRARVLRAQGKIEHAIISLDRAIALDETDTVAYMDLGSLLLEARDHTGAISAYTAALMVDPRYVPAWIARSHTHYRDRNFTQAVADLTRALAIQPRSAELLTFRSNAHRQGGEYIAALRDADAALALEPDNVSAGTARVWAFIGRAQAEQSDDFAAIAAREADDLLRRHAPSVPLYRLQSRAYQFLAELRPHSAPRAIERARRAFDMAIKLDPNDVSLYRDKALQIKQRADYDAAIVAYARAAGAERDRGNVDGAQDLGNAMYQFRLDYALMTGGGVLCGDFTIRDHKSCDTAKKLTAEEFLGRLWDAQRTGQVPPTAKP
jgi:tetratricopeptide (TPR) repeat protein